MNKLLNYRYITTTILLLFVFLSSTYSKEPLIYKIDIKQEINSSSWIYLQSGINEAHKNEADYIILDMNTYGGLVIYADSIRTLLLNTEIPLLAYVNNNAASAGALIAIACDSIYMKKGEIGRAHV